MLAIRRGEEEGVLRVRIAPPEEDALGAARAAVRQGAGHARLASRFAWRRTTATSGCSAPPSKARSGSSRRRRPTPRRSGSSPTTCASSCSRRRSARRRVLAIDPGFRTGCKVVVPRRAGQAAAPRRRSTRPRRRPTRSSAPATTVLALAARFEVEAIAIGNGTAGRETEEFVRALGLPAVDHRGGGQRERRLDLLGQRGGARGVPRPGRHRARRGVHRPPADGPAGGAGEDRSEVHRRRPVPARRGPARAQARPGRRGRCRA